MNWAIIFEPLSLGAVSRKALSHCQEGPFPPSATLDGCHLFRGQFLPPG